MTPCVSILGTARKSSLPTFAPCRGRSPPNSGSGGSASLAARLFSSVPYREYDTGGTPTFPGQLTASQLENEPGVAEGHFHAIRKLGLFDPLEVVA